MLETLPPAEQVLDLMRRPGAIWPRDLAAFGLSRV